MTEQELENAIRDLCDKSGLGNGDLAGVLDALKVGYEMLEEEESAE